MKQVKGFTVIELMIVVAIGGILVAIALPAYKRHQAGGQLIEHDPYRPKLACVNGYSYTVDYNGTATQQFNAQGGGVSCVGR